MPGTPCTHRRVPFWEDGEHERGLFLSGGGGGGGTKSLRLLPCSALSLSIPRFFPSSSLPLLASQPPLFSLRAPLFLLPRRFCRAPFSSFSPLFLSLSLSLAPRGNRSIELTLFSSFSHFAKLATILPCPAFLSLSLSLSVSHPVPTTAEAIEHTSDGDTRYRRVHLTKIERKKEEKGGSRDGGTETDVFEPRKRSFGRARSSRVE